MKQADVVLLGFPLMHPMSSDIRRNDLEMYEPVTELNGPAMTWVRRGAKPKGGFRHEVVVSSQELVTASPLSGHDLSGLLSTLRECGQCRAGDVR